MMGAMNKPMIDDSPVIAKASINSTTLLNARQNIVQMGLIDGDGYPEVRNRNGYVDTILKFMQIVAKRNEKQEQPDQVWITVREGNDDDGNPIPPRYTIVIEDEERMMGTQRTLAVIMLYRPTREMESLSVIADDKITWSADTQKNTAHNKRTVYYLGFLSLMAVKTADFDKEPMPEHEMSAEDLMSEAIGIVPSQLQTVPVIGSVDDDNGETGEASGSAGTEYAGTWHNGKTKEEEDRQESQEFTNDMMTSFEDFENLAGVSDA